MSLEKLRMSELVTMKDRLHAFGAIIGESGRYIIRELEEEMTQIRHRKGRKMRK